MSAKPWFWLVCAACLLGNRPVLAEDDLSNLRPGTKILFDRGGEQSGEFVSYIGVSGKLMKVRVMGPNGITHFVIVPIDKARLADGAKSSPRRVERPGAAGPQRMRTGPGARAPLAATRPARPTMPSAPGTNPPPAGTASGDSGLIVGRWIPVSMKLNGRNLEAGADETATFTRKDCRWLGVTFAYELKSTATPKEITLWLPSRSPAEFEYKGIYELGAEGLRLCLTNSLADTPPHSFAAQPDDAGRLIEMKKESAKAADAKTAEITAFLDQSIALFTAEDYDKFLVLVFPPADLARMSADERQQQIAFIKKSRTDFLKVLRSMREAEAQFSPDGTEATFDVPSLGSHGNPKIKKIDGKWRLI